MLKVKPLEVGIVEVKSTVRITHPKANLLTVQIGQNAFCNFPVTVEIALSDGYKFLDYALPEFAQWAFLIDDNEEMKYYNMRNENHDAHVMTYRDVPITALAKFINMYAEK